MKKYDCLDCGWIDIRPTDSPPIICPHCQQSNEQIRRIRQETTKKITAKELDDMIIAHCRDCDLSISRKQLYDFSYHCLRCGELLPDEAPLPATQSGIKSKPIAVNKLVLIASRLFLAAVAIGALLQILK